VIAVIAVVGIVIASSGGGGGGAPGGITADARGDVWVSHPSEGAVTRIDASGRKQDFHIGGKPQLIAGGADGIWVSDGSSLTLRDLRAGVIKQVALSSAPTALAASREDGSVWAAEPGGTIAHATASGQLEASAAKVSPAPAGISLGAGWLWAVSGSRLTRIGLGGNHPIMPLDAGAPQAIAVTSDRGIWIAHADGTITRFDPRPTKMGINTTKQLAADLSGITAADGGPYVWATSSTGLYRLRSDGDGTGQQVASFNSPPVGVAVLSSSVWVATKDGKLTQIRF
jgi:streptogramin lyase